MKYPGFSSLKDVLIHLGIVTAVGILAILVFFFIYLPTTTNHGETITVPDVVGISYDDLDEFLTKRNLRYEVTADSGFSTNYAPNTVLKQVPKPNSKVKEDRKIYLTLNSSSPPLVRMPNLIEGSVKNAQLVLKMYDLKLGKREYVPDLFLNTVLKQQVDGEDIEPGTMVAKGTPIDLILGDGLGRQELEAPNVITLDEESAQIAIIGSGLSVGEITYTLENTGVIPDVDEEGNETTIEVLVGPGAVYRQRPRPGASMRLNGIVDIWVHRPDSLGRDQSLLDN
jgi:eukaryotic-like serine/threonine-protein kinase